MGDVYEQKIFEGAGKSTLRSAYCELKFLPQNYQLRLSGKI